MTIAAAQYARFRREAVAKGRVYTFTHEGDYLVFRIGEHDVVPFWSSESRLRRVQAQHPKYAAYSIESMSLREFLDWLPEIREEGIHIGVNWSGSRLIGYDVSTEDLAAALEAERKNASLPTPLP